MRRSVTAESIPTKFCTSTPWGDVVIYLTHTHTHLTALFPGLPGWAGTRKEKTNLDFTEARDSEWQWHQLGHMQVCISLQTDNHASTSSLNFYRPNAVPDAQPTVSKHTRINDIQIVITALTQSTECHKNNPMIQARTNSSQGKCLHQTTGKH